MLSKDFSWESVFRIRISNGWETSKIYGNFIIKSTDLLNVPNMHESQTYVYDFNINDMPRSDVFNIQV